jgi:5-methylcytosine-specific restriction protein A
MNTFLLTWNPLESSVEEIERAWNRLCKGKQAEAVQWSCGSNKSIPVGGRVFFHRQRAEPRGIVASGWVTRATYQDVHWQSERADRGDMANYVDWRVDAVVPSFGDEQIPEPLQAHLVPNGPLQKDIIWDNMPGSGIQISDSAAEELEMQWALHIDRKRDNGPQGEALSATENRRYRQLAWSRSRERALRDAKILDAIKESPDGRLRCGVPGCGFCFEEMYGDVGKQYAHVHHLNALNHSEREVVTTLEDLAIVCANCHAMIHRNNECRSMDGLVIK